MKGGNAGGLHGPPATRDRGAVVVEYALIVALVAIVCLAALTRLGTVASAKLNGTATLISGSPTPAAIATTTTTTTRPTTTTTRKGNGKGNGS